MTYKGLHSFLADTTSQAVVVVLRLYRHRPDLSIIRLARFFLVPSLVPLLIQSCPVSPTPAQMSRILYTSSIPYCTPHCVLPLSWTPYGLLCHTLVIGTVGCHPTGLGAYFPRKFDLRGYLTLLQAGVVRGCDTCVFGPVEGGWRAPIGWILRNLPRPLYVTGHFRPFILRDRAFSANHFPPATLTVDCRIPTKSSIDMQTVEIIISSAFKADEIIIYSTSFLQVLL